MQNPLPFIVLITALLSGCMQSDPLRGVLGSYRNYTDFNGKIADGVLHDPHGRFIIKVPPLLTPGAVIRGRLEQEGGSVDFSDDMGKFIRIDISTAIDAESRETLHEGDWKAIFSGNRIFMGELYRSVSPGSEILHQEYIFTERPIDFYIFKLPKGATLSDQTGRLDAWRASITIIEGDSLFTLTTQHVLGLWRKDATQEEVFADMQKTLLETLKTVTFASARTPTP